MLCILITGTKNGLPSCVAAYEVSTLCSWQSKLPVTLPGSRCLWKHYSSVWHTYPCIWLMGGSAGSVIFFFNFFCHTVFVSCFLRLTCPTSPYNWVFAGPCSSASFPQVSKRSKRVSKIHFFKILQKLEQSGRNLVQQKCLYVKVV